MDLLVTVGLAVATILCIVDAWLKRDAVPLVQIAGAIGFGVLVLSRLQGEV